LTAHVALVETPKPQHGIEFPIAKRKGGLYANSVETDLTELEHKQIMEMWRVTHEPYRLLLERYETYVKGVKKYNRNKKVTQSVRRTLPLHTWQPKDRKIAADETKDRRATLEAQFVEECAMQRAHVHCKKAQVIY
jgi:hypothetical protein